MDQTSPLSLRGFLLSGLLFALLGALLPAWGYHLTPRNAPTSFYFLCLAAGILLYGAALRRFVPPARTLPVGSLIAAAAFIALSYAAPPAPDYWRYLGWLAIGSAAGLLNAGLFEAMRPAYQLSPASTITTAAVYFTAGCLLSALLVAGAFYLYSVGAILRVIALIPAVFAFLYWRAPPSATHEPEPPIRDALRDFLSPGAVLFALLLFFQSASEWAIAGWLPIFLIRRLGISPSTAIWILALYWFALLAGRVATIYLLPAVRHGRLLFFSAAAALVGCLLLSLTDNLLGAITGILLVGLGFAAIYPLVSERIGRRFPYYHPGVFHSIFSLALVGGMLGPWTIGPLSDWAGLGVVMGLPALGTLMVVILLLLIWLESKVTGQ